MSVSRAASVIRPEARPELMSNANLIVRAGARVGGLGNMPGWWFTIESTTTRHFIHQFKTAIEDALRSKPAVRAIMRARATKQRFPVSRWVEDLEKLQASAIELSHKQAAKEKRPMLETPSTPTILETPSVLGVLRSRVSKPSLRARPARTLVPKASVQGGGLDSIAEGRLLAGPGPGLGSKTGPSSKRKRPPPPLFGNSLGAVPKVLDFAANNQADDATTNTVRRPSMFRSPTAPSHIPIHTNQEQKFGQPSKRPTFQRAPTMPIPELRPQDRKAVKLLGMQLPASRVNTSMAPENAPSSSDENSSSPSSANGTPSTPNTPSSSSSDDTTNISAKSSPLAAIDNTSNRTSVTNPTSVSASGTSTQSSSNRTSYNTSTSKDGPGPTDKADSKPMINFAPTIAATRPKVKAAPAIAAAKPIVSTPRAVDQFPSLGGHYFPHGSVAVLSASEIQEEKPDNMLQNVTPFFSDPKKEYENQFQQKLKKLSGKNSEHELCIEEYLLKSEKLWFGKLRAAELSKPAEGELPEEPSTAMVEEVKKKAREDGFGLGDNHQPPPGLKRFMRRKIGDWPVYSFLLAFVSSPCTVIDS